jgi:prepilin-type N-terminal cleavage/methylation domain-containing protein
MKSFHNFEIPQRGREPASRVGRVSSLRAAIANRPVPILSDGAHGLSRHSYATAEVTRPALRSVEETQMKQLTATCWRQMGARAFTLVELLVVLAVVALLTAVAVSSSVTSRSHVLQAQCTGNLRQIGVALNVYGAEAKEYLPTCKYRDINTWYTYEVARVTPGTGNLEMGFYNLGLLFRAKAVVDARVFYCPATTFRSFTYDYYASTTNGWPSSPDSNEYLIRTGYNYFPQLRKTQQVGGYTLPLLTVSGSEVAPAKLTEVNPKKSITTDLVSSVSLIPHRANDSFVGINALFPDGRAAFQNARNDSPLFDNTLWTGIGNDGLNFRIVMNSWKP